MFNGRALFYPGLLVGGWIGARVLILNLGEDRLPTAMPTRIIVPQSDVAARDPIPALSTAQRTGDASLLHRHIYFDRTQSIRPSEPPRDSVDHIPLTSEQKLLPLTAGPMLPPAVPMFTRPANPPLVAAPSGQSDVGTRRWQGYAYGFWRLSNGNSTIAVPGGQYGGSQYGAIATWDPLGSAGKGAAFLLRASGTPDGRQQEVAVGARWQPDREWPLSLSVERRFRFSGKDGFAAYVAGGVDHVPLVRKLELDAYGQAGYASGGIAGPFVDAQVKVQHPLAKPLGIPIRIGAGAWVGGQKGTHRADIGPTISARFDNRFADFTLQLDWRKRVVGNASPADGLALTVSTGF